MYGVCVGAYQSQKKGSDSLWLESWIAVSYPNMGAGSQISRTLQEQPSTPNHCAILPAHILFQLLLTTPRFWVNPLRCSVIVVMVVSF